MAHRQAWFSHRIRWVGRAAASQLTAAGLLSPLAAIAAIFLGGAEPVSNVLGRLSLPLGVAMVERVPMRVCGAHITARGGAR